MSSLGNATIDTVVSCEWSAAHFCIAYVKTSLAFFRESSFAVLAAFLIISAFSAETSLSTSCKSFSFACSFVNDAICCNFTISSSYIFLTSSFWSSNSLICFFTSSSFFSKLSERLSRFSSLCNSLVSCLCTSPLLSLIS